MAVREAVQSPRLASHCRSSASWTIPCAHKRLVYRGRPLVMGVLNVTPDSFSDGGRFFDPEAAIERGIQMVAEGADLIDIGGESTRPGSQRVPLDEELRRVLPVVKRLAKSVRLPLSVDTSKAEVAERTIDVGASLVNDVTALRNDPRMVAVLARNKAAVILMHMQGTPETMQKRPRYRNVLHEIGAFLQRAAAQAQERGIERSRILVDPGLGFGKTPNHNLELLRDLAYFVSLGWPVVVGPSRKSFIGHLLHAEAGDRLAGTLACIAQAQRCGAHIVRVHDVRLAVQLLQMLEAIERKDATRR